MFKDKRLQNKNIENNAGGVADPDAHTPNLDFDPIRRLREKMSLKMKMKMTKMMKLCKKMMMT